MIHTVLWMLSSDAQIAAQRLAICNDIGEASYVDSLVAAALVVRCKALPDAPEVLARMQQRYGLDPLAGTGEDYVQAVAERMFLGGCVVGGGGCSRWGGATAWTGED